MLVRLFSDIGHIMTKADENLNVHVHCLYDDVRNGKGRG